MSGAPKPSADENPIGEIVVTREMRDAGEAVFDDLIDSYPPALLVEAVYKAMRALEGD